MNKTVIAVVVFVSAGLIGYASWAGFIKPSNGEEFLGGANASMDSTFVTGTPNYGTQDVVGTHVGTTTIGASFANPNTTNTYVSVIGNNIKQAVYQIKIVAVTSSDNNISFTVQGSNDYLCGTQAGNGNATTNTVQANINWYDAMSHLKGRVHPTTLGNGSSTIVYDWNDATAGSAQEIVLTDLNYECLRLLLSTSSTKPYVGINTRN